ncbi:MAG: AAA family ATPase [Gammaproteobacteria bacterium]
MKKVIIFGNSGSGKSTLAKRLSHEGLAHLDLDTLAWVDGSAERAPINESRAKIESFMAEHASWVIEGCYADLLSVALAHATELVFMNLPIELCIENARNRPWEPHKYESKAAQDANLDMLTSWIAQYDEREDVFSRAAHHKLYSEYTGTKRMIIKNEAYDN